MPKKKAPKVKGASTTSSTASDVVNVPVFVKVFSIPWKELKPKKPTPPAAQVSLFVQEDPTVVYLGKKQNTEHRIAETKYDGPGVGYEFTTACGRLAETKVHKWSLKLSTIVGVVRCGSCFRHLKRPPAWTCPRCKATSRTFHGTVPARVALRLLRAHRRRLHPAPAGKSATKAGNGPPRPLESWGLPGPAKKAKKSHKSPK